MLTDVQQILLDTARRSRDAAHAPYSNFKVGAAVHTTSGHIFAGCNVENASYGLSMCAERVAIFTAVAAGETRLITIAICSDSPQPSTPCGACRQVLFEFGPGAQIIMGNLNGISVVSNLDELFPRPFQL
jgi:cytidine deaminase